MKAVVQRVTSGNVSVDSKVIARIDLGYVVLLGAKQGDEKKDATKLAEKLAQLRIMADESQKMNKSLLDVGGAVLVVSQFTLLANVKKGRRPSFIHAAEPKVAKELYEFFIVELRRLGIKKVATGKFGAYMSVNIVNDGPVTIILDTEEF